MPVRQRTYDELNARYQASIERRNDAESDCTDHVSLVKRLSGQVDALREQLAKRPSPDAYFRSEQARASLDKQIGTLQLANEAQAAELQDLQTRVAS